MSSAGVRAKKFRKVDAKAIKKYVVEKTNKPMAESRRLYKQFVKNRPKIREAITHGQRGLCYYCREPLMETCWGDGDHDPTLDHVVPKCDGGKNAAENLVVACRKCNQEKGGLNVSEFELLRSYRHFYWPSRIIMPDAQEALLGHLQRIEGRLWYKPSPGEPDVLPRLWKTPDKAVEAESKVRSWVRHLASRLFRSHGDESPVGPGEGGSGSEEVERPQEPEGPVGCPVLVDDHKGPAKGALITRPDAPVLPRIRRAAKKSGV